MVFSSLVFLCVFLPAVWLLQLILPSVRLKNALLLISSVIFYAYGEPVYVLLLLFSAFVNWAFAILIDRRIRPRLFLVLAAIVNLSLLCIFKYAGFAVSLINEAFSLSIPEVNIALPVGISFYTFQALSYVIDVYRGECGVQRSYPKLLLYISFFPQLIAGPIVRYRDVENALSSRKITPEECARGMKRFLYGLSKKVLIANTVAAAADTLFGAGMDRIGTGAAWVAAFAYLLQIYFDFSGYSDMAIGLGHMFGFTFPENFRYPYAASSIRDFWRRWHISLSTWLREYLYIPLGGNRRGRARTVFNKMAVFLLCGLWHGANVTFLFWGFYHGMLQLMEEAVPFFRKKEHGIAGRIFSHAYTVLAVMTGFVIFRADTLTQGFMMLARMFTWHASSGSGVLLWSVLTPAFIAAAAAGCLACLPVDKLLRRLRIYPALSAAASVVLGAACLLNLAGGSYNPFIYFRF